MTFKKIAALFAAAALSANTLCFSAYADLPEDDFIISGGFITGYVGDGGDVVIPEGIVGIEEGAFRKNDNITNLVISENCVSLESFAFSQCSELKTVVFEGDMEKVGMMSFIGCPMLESVKFMGNVYAKDDDLDSGIGANAFMGCRSLKTVEFAEDTRVDVIKRAAFMDCAVLSDVKLPKDVGEIHDNVFTNCPVLERLDIPSMTILEDYAAGYMYSEITEETLKADGETTVRADLTFDMSDESFEPNYSDITQVPITLTVEKGSPAEKYAVENGINYVYYGSQTEDNSQIPETGGKSVFSICAAMALSLAVILKCKKH